MGNKRELVGCRVAITGGARGIGLATAKEFASRGASVVIGDLSADAIDAAVAEIGPSASGHLLDVADHDSFATFYDAAGDDGRVDILVNNAGIMPIGHFEDQTSETVRRALDVNVMGCLNGMHVAVGDMAARGSGHIVNLASTAGKSPVPGGLVYCATKAAVVMATETARIEYAGTGVDFTCVMPHFTRTELISGTTQTRFIPVASPADVASAIADGVAVGRKDVYAPAMMTPVMASQRFLTRGLRDRFGQFLGAYDSFLRFDSSARSGYDSRIGRG